MIIRASRLSEIHDSAQRAAALCPGPWGCNHGYLCVDREPGRLLATGVGLEGAMALRLAAHLDPAMVLELIKGYRAAKDAGILRD